MQPDWDINKQMVQRVEALGFKALVITVDVPILGNRRGNKRNELNLEANIKLKDLRSPGEVRKMSNSMGIHYKKHL